MSKESNEYKISMIREDSKLSLRRKVDLYKKFEKYLGGGSLFTIGLNKQSVEEQLKSLINSRLNAFQLEI